MRWCVATLLVMAHTPQPQRPHRYIAYATMSIDHAVSKVASAPREPTLDTPPAQPPAPPGVPARSRSARREAAAAPYEIAVLERGGVNAEGGVMAMAPHCAGRG